MTIDVGNVVSVIAALLSFIAAIAVASINSKSQTSKVLAELHEQIALVIYRLTQLENKVSAHNNFDSRIVALEARVETISSFNGQDSRNDKKG